MQYLYGSYTHNLDERGRLAMPSRLRDRLGDSVWVTKGKEKCLMVYPEATFDALVKHVLDSAPWDSAGVDMRLYFFGDAVQCEFDKQGRILVPANLRADVAIEDGAIIIGAGDHLQVWDPAVWAAKRQKLDEQPPSLVYLRPDAVTS
jgi:MraZ protein